MFCPIREAYDLQRRGDILAPLLRRELGQQQRKLNILRRSEDWHQIVKLEDELVKVQTEINQYLTQLEK